MLQYEVTAQNSAIDRLAEEGLMFTDAHAPHSTCVASRYGLLTGRYPIRDNHRFIKPRKIALPKLLKWIFAKQGVSKSLQLTGHCQRLPRRVSSRP
jgi:hypothetical protein